MILKKNINNMKYKSKIKNYVSKFYTCARCLSITCAVTGVQSTTFAVTGFQDAHADIFYGSDSKLLSYSDKRVTH